MRRRKTGLKFLLCFSTFFAPLFFFVSLSAIAQDSDNIDSSFKNTVSINEPKLCVRKIIIKGNIKTKSYIILREMPMREGDSVTTSIIKEELQKARDFIYNTTLFIEVKVFPRVIDSNDFDIIVEVKERWYIFPIPYIELADRSFNEWLEKYNADFNRISYGMWLSLHNIRGRKDQLVVSLINGFKRNISFEYSVPYTNASLSTGLSIGAGYSQTREISYQTDYTNGLLFFKNDHFVKNEWYVTSGFSSRKALKKRESFIVTFRHINLDDSIIAYKNSGYFNSNSSTQNFIELEYKLQFTDVDNILYPLKGYITSFSLKKQGISLRGGINEFTLKTVFNKYYSYPHQWYSSIRFTGEIKLPFSQPYFNQKALGYKEDYLRGYEYFVIDGVAFALSKLDIKKKLLFFNIPTFINSKTYNKIPVTIYAKAFADLGYVYSHAPFSSALNNQFLYSGGFGLDIVTLYDFKISVEFSMNQLGQKGLFLHR